LSTFGYNVPSGSLARELSDARVKHLNLSLCRRVPAGRYLTNDALLIPSKLKVLVRTGFESWVIDGSVVGIVSSTPEIVPLIHRTAPQHPVRRVAGLDQSRSCLDRA
jgi:hypothetical protein